MALFFIFFNPIKYPPKKAAKKLFHPFFKRFPGFLSAGTKKNVKYFFFYGPHPFFIIKIFFFPPNFFWEKKLSEKEKGPPKNFFFSGSTGGQKCSLWAFF